MHGLIELGAWVSFRHKLLIAYPKLCNPAAQFLLKPTERIGFAQA